MLALGTRRLSYAMDQKAVRKIKLWEDFEAAWFGVNVGRISEIATRQVFSHVKPANQENLLPPGTYFSEQEAHVTIQALNAAQRAIDQAETLLKSRAQIRGRRSTRPVFMHMNVYT